jgi:hypothetical protein
MFDGRLTGSLSRFGVIGAARRVAVRGAPCTQAQVPTMSGDIVTIKRTRVALRRHACNQTGSFGCSRPALFRRPASLDVALSGSR